MALHIEPGLSVESDSLSEYKTMVDTLLVDLTGGDAHHGKLADGTLPSGTLGSGFPEAEALFTSYDTVITELQKLSKGLAGQIEALGIAILTAGKGYDGVDEETKRRMAAIAKEARDQYVPQRDPWLEEQRRLTAAHQPPSGTSRGTY
ncbi:hypothetical protein [Streptomyces sp. NPDC091371]|uniref:hypothetical protein n=1 Tax=Streptomyces sp. NPDC091371 TaxID=3155303 RepID=UPI0034132D0E